MASNEDGNVLAAADESRPAGPAEAPASDPDVPAATGRGGWRGVVTTVALVVACLVILNTGIQILPDDPIAASVPVLSVLTLQRVLILIGIICLLIASPRRETFATPVDIPVALLVLLAAGSVYRAGFPLLSGDDGSPLRRFVTAVAMLYLVVGVLRRHRDATPVLLVTVLAAAFVASSTGLAQYSQSVNTGFCRAGLVNTETCEPGAVIRSIGTFTNPNLLSGYLIMALPLTVGLLRGGTSRRFRLAWWVLAGLGLLGLLVTFSRAATFALVVVVLVGLVVAALRGRRWQVVGLPVAVIVSGVTLAVLLVALVTGTFARITGRQDLWDAALAAARRGGLDGVGYGRAGDVMSALSGADYAHAHNLWLNWLIDVGPLGPVVITALLVVAGVAGARRATAGSLLAAGAVGSLAAISIASLTDHPTTLARNVVLLFVVVGCAVAGPAPVPRRGGGHVADALIPASRRSVEMGVAAAPGRLPSDLPPGSHAHVMPAAVPVAFGGDEPTADHGPDPADDQQAPGGAGRALAGDAPPEHPASWEPDREDWSEPGQGTMSWVDPTAGPAPLPAAGDPGPVARASGRGRLGRRFGRRQEVPPPSSLPAAEQTRVDEGYGWTPPVADQGVAMDDTGFGGVPIVPFGPPQDADAVTAAIPLIGGYAVSGYTPDAGTRSGYEEQSYPPVGYAANGHVGENGYDANGYGENGYAENGYGENGYDAHGYDANGYDANGYDANGYDANGYDANGYAPNGHAFNGFAPSGYARNGYTPEGYRPNGHVDDPVDYLPDLWDRGAPGADGDPYGAATAQQDAGRRGRRRGRRDPRGR